MSGWCTRYRLKMVTHCSEHYGVHGRFIPTCCPRRFCALVSAAFCVLRSNLGNEDRDVTDCHYHNSCAEQIETILMHCVLAARRARFSCELHDVSPTWTGCAMTTSFVFPIPFPVSDMTDFTVTNPLFGDVNRGAAVYFQSGVSNIHLLHVYGRMQGRRSLQFAVQQPRTDQLPVYSAV